MCKETSSIFVEQFNRCRVYHVAVRQRVVVLSVSTNRETCFFMSGHGNVDSIVHMIDVCMRHSQGNETDQILWERN